VEHVWKLTNIDKWFLCKLKNIIELEFELRKYNHVNIKREMLLNAKRLGFSDRQIAKAVGSNELAIRKIRQDFNIVPLVKQIDTGNAYIKSPTLCV
jgi:carbamoyl-phosphate synthase / aspartate carbamoyltransferase